MRTLCHRLKGVEGENSLLLTGLGALLGSRLLPSKGAMRLPFQHASELC
jgi:hypothetical protein